jgi:hypothetical protein
MVKKISDNEIYFLVKYIKSVLWRVAKLLSYIEDSQCLKFKSLSTLLGKDQIWQHFCSYDIKGQRRKGSRFLLKYSFEFMNPMAEAPGERL